MRRIRSDIHIGSLERKLGVGNIICHTSGRNVRSDCHLGTLRKLFRK